MNMSDVQRIDGWKTAIRALRARPLRALTFGWGPETFQAVYRLHRTRASADLIGFDRVADHAHNLPLELLVTAGVVGTTAFVYLIRSLWRDADREARAAMLGLGIMSMVEPVFFPPAAMLFLLLGVRRKDALLQSRPAPRTWATIFAIVAAGMLALDLVGYVARPLLLHPHESEANQLAVMAALQRNDLAQAVVYAERATAADPMHRVLAEQTSQLEAAVKGRQSR